MAPNSNALTHKKSVSSSSKLISGNLNQPIINSNTGAGGQSQTMQMPSNHPGNTQILNNLGSTNVQPPNQGLNQKIQPTINQQVSNSGGGNQAITTRIDLSKSIPDSFNFIQMAQNNQVTGLTVVPHHHQHPT